MAYPPIEQCVLTICSIGHHVLGGVAHHTAAAPHIPSQAENKGDAEERAHASPYTRFDELAVHVVPTDDYGLSDIDGHKI